MLRIGPLAALAFLGSSCSPGGFLSIVEPAISEIPHSGDRRDVGPLSDHGNASFSAATFDDQEKLLVTAIGGGAPFWGPLQVWDAKTGRLLTNIKARIPTGLWMIDSTRERLLGLSGKDLQLFDLRSGREISTVPDGASTSARAAGLTGDGNEVLIFKPGYLEVWQLDPPLLSRRAKSPLPPEHYFPACVGGVPFTYNDKTCYEWSPDRRTLALAYTPVFSPMSESHFLLIDLATLESRELTLPSERNSRTLAAFAFSPDGQRLAIGTDQELLTYDRALDRWGPTIYGDHNRNRFVGAMRFTSDGSRVIALEDLAQVSVYDVAAGTRVGRQTPPNWDSEAVFGVSRDGSRIVLYHFDSDVLEVLDGRDTKRLGWVCPYFCNTKHNPNDAPFALSPDGQSIAVSHRHGTAVWNVATDTLKFKLYDPQRPPLQR